MSDKSQASTAEPDETETAVASEEASPADAVVAQPVATATPVSPDVAPVAEAPKAESAPEAPKAGSAPEAGDSIQPAADTAAQPRVVYVDAPLPPKMKGNRGIGTLFVALAALLYAAIFAVVFVVAGRAELVGSGAFFVPVATFVLASVLLVLLLNRANWWAHVIGSLFVGAAVYFGSIGGILLINNVVFMTGEEAATRFAAGLVDPIIIVAALLAREVSLWAGAAISARGRSVKARNAEAKAAYERESAQRRAAFDAANSSAKA